MELSIDNKELDKFLMIGDKVLIKPTNPQGKTKSGLLLPPLVQESDFNKHTENNLIFI